MPIEYAPIGLPNGSFCTTISGAFVPTELEPHITASPDIAA